MQIAYFKVIFLGRRFKYHIDMFLKLIIWFFAAMLYAIMIIYQGLNSFL